MKKRQGVMMAASVAFLFAAMPGYAQMGMGMPCEGKGCGQHDADPQDEQREQLRAKMEATRTQRLSDALNLDTTTRAKFNEVIASFNEQRTSIMKKQRETMRELRTMLQSTKPEEPRLKLAIDTLSSNHKAMQELQDREFKSLRQILSVEQQARFLVTQMDVMRDMRGMMAEARGGAGPGMRGHGPTGSDLKTDK